MRESLARTRVPVERCRCNSSPMYAPRVDPQVSSSTWCCVDAKTDLTTSEFARPLFIVKHVAAHHGLVVVLPAVGMVPVVCVFWWSLLSLLTSFGEVVERVFLFLSFILTIEADCEGETVSGS